MIECAGGGGGITELTGGLRDEKVIRRRAFSFMSLTTFSFRIATSVFSSSICSAVWDFFGLDGGDLAGVSTDMTITSSRAILLACSSIVRLAADNSCFSARCSSGVLTAEIVGLDKDCFVAPPEVVDSVEGRGTPSFEWTGATTGAGKAMSPVAGGTSESQCIQSSAERIAGFPFGQAGYKSAEQASILRGTTKDIVWIAEFSSLSPRRTSFFSVSTTRLGNRQNPR